MHLAASDFRIDLSLNFLSLLVSGAIALALVWYLFVILSPMIDTESMQASESVATVDHEDIGPPASAAIDRLAAFVPETRPPAYVRNALTVFRCEAQGRVTYTDRPCERGGMRVLQLRPN
jgi:hypothetical protein